MSALQPGNAGRHEQFAGVGTDQRALRDRQPEHGQGGGQQAAEGRKECQVQHCAQLEGGQGEDAQRKGESPPAEVERHAVAQIPRGDQQRHQH